VRQPRTDQLADPRHIAAATGYPPIQGLPTLFELGPTDATHGDRIAESSEHLGHAIRTGLVDLRVRLALFATARPHQGGPPVPIEESRGPRELVLVQAS